MSEVATPPPLRVRGECVPLSGRYSIPCLLSLQDGSVKVWEWLAGRLLHSEQVGREVGGTEGVVRETEAVTKVCCSLEDPTFVVTLLEK